MAALTKLRPDQCAYLRGFDGFGAAAFLHGASATGFAVSGVFRDAADFAVVVLYDIDNFFEPPRIKYLPDPDLDGAVLSFDLTYSNLQPIDSPKFPTIDWAYLDVALYAGGNARIPLFDHATPNGGTWSSASGTFSIATPKVVAGDRLTLWYQNAAFDYFANPGDHAEDVATALAAQINGSSLGGSYTLGAAASGPELTITAYPRGYDGNMIAMYSIAATSNLTATPVVQFSGGSSAATWRIAIDFTALGIGQARQMWLTLAPQLANGAAYAPSNWDAVFVNWTLTGGKQALQVAGPGSVRIEETDSWCKLTGSGWSSLSTGGFYSKGFAAATGHAGDSASFDYWCQFAHDLWMGTALYVDRGIVSVSIDGVAAAPLDMYLNELEPVVTRRRISSGLTAGNHKVVLTLTATPNVAASGNNWYLDFLEAAVASDPPVAAVAFTDRSPALDFDTDSTYKISPERLMNMFDLMGWRGPMNEYVGVFWWNQRTNFTAVFPTATVTFGGFAAGDQIFVSISGEAAGKTVFPADSSATIASHFAYFINETYTGVWAQASGPALTITPRSTTAAYQFSLAVSTTSAGGKAAVTGSLTGGSPGSWDIDTSITPPMNYGAASWHADLYAQVAARGLEITSAFSMELVNPPAGFAAQFPDGTAITTATGFSSLVSTQCAFGSEMRAYQTVAYLQIAQLQAAAGLTPELQFGEFLWWYFANSSGMGYYDAETKGAAQAALGRPLHVFLAPNDDPSVNGYADARFLASRLAGHVAALVAAVKAQYPTAKFEVLYPYDVNYPSVIGIYKLGGRLNAYVNFPSQWQNPAAAGFDRLKMEALDFGSGDRNLDWSLQAMRFPFRYGWPKTAVRYLVACFNGGCPWVAEQTLALAEVSCINHWAFDHVCLFGWDVGLEIRTFASLD